MTGNTFVAGALSAALIALAGVGAPAAAAERGASIEIIDEIRSTAPRLTRVPATGGVADMLIVRKDAVVWLADLDLALAADLKEMENRVRAAAKLLCEELEREYPRGQPRFGVCVRRAVDDAMAQVEVIFPELAGL